METMPAEVSILQGQCCILHLKIENVGRFDVDRVILDVQSSNTLLAKYARDVHPTMPFQGAYMTLSLASFNPYAQRYILGPPQGHIKKADERMMLLQAPMGQPCVRKHHNNSCAVCSRCTR